jgi:hypothetical protein
VSEETSFRADREVRLCPAFPTMAQRRSLIVQQEKLLKSAVSDYIDRIVDRRGLHQCVITQPRPTTDVGSPIHRAARILVIRARRDLAVNLDNPRYLDARGTVRDLLRSALATAG